MEEPCVAGLAEIVEGLGAGRAGGVAGEALSLDGVGVGPGRAEGEAGSLRGVVEGSVQAAQAGGVRRAGLAGGEAGLAGARRVLREESLRAGLGAKVVLLLVEEPGAAARALVLARAETGLALRVAGPAGLRRQVTEGARGASLEAPAGGSVEEEPGTAGQADVEGRAGLAAGRRGAAHALARLVVVEGPARAPGCALSELRLEEEPGLAGEAGRVGGAGLAGRRAGRAQVVRGAWVEPGRALRLENAAELELTEEEPGPAGRAEFRRLGAGGAPLGAGRAPPLAEVGEEPGRAAQAAGLAVEDEPLSAGGALGVEGSEAALALLVADDAPSRRLVPEEAVRAG